MLVSCGDALLINATSIIFFLFDRENLNDFYFNSIYIFLKTFVMRFRWVRGRLPRCWRQSMRNGFAMDRKRNERNRLDRRSDSRRSQSGPGTRLCRSIFICLCLFTNRRRKLSAFPSIEEVQETFTSFYFCYKA